MAKINGGGPAFPFNHTADAEDMANGMNLLDYFAASVLPTLAIGMYKTPGATAKECEEKLATAAYAVAYAMIAERQKARPE